ncbi:uncharacterized protein BXZ73DRAFT_57709 [Epithele typhae]|uniref:uncharacterized protein n=1 Tax=Epithele typhae TaxID=378194 RepID=UPI0020089C28|nr:uncharacterized protein BXZ73DRAFT_57709 [Epithele typhae]KAH9910803.1 hypothetical protein BXZ73DRAFT_57709 [Epithele typhae]
MAEATTLRKKHEDQGYILQKESALSKAIVAELRQRRGHTAFQWVKGHQGHDLNELADELAGKAAEKSRGNRVSTKVPDRLVVTGARLDAMTQALAYKAIRQRRDAATDPRPRTVKTVKYVLSDLKTDFGADLHERTLWTSLRKKDLITKEARQWMWMVLHDAYWIGNKWLEASMPADLQDRAFCTHCNSLEDMTHILFACEEPGREIVWDLLTEHWQNAGGPLIAPTWGSVLGAACVPIVDDEGARKTTLERRWTILATESAHLIWKLRCERVIGRENEPFSEIEVRNRWYATLDRRLDLERRYAALTEGRKRAKRLHAVEAIWAPLIQDDEDLPPNWVEKCGVLVGICRTPYDRLGQG